MGEIEKVYFLIICFQTVHKESNSVKGLQCYTSGLLFQNLVPTLPTTQFSQLRDITWGNSIKWHAASFVREHWK